MAELIVAEAVKKRTLELVVDLEEDNMLSLETHVTGRSDSAFWEGLDGEVGVFVATYREVPIGSDVRLTVHTSVTSFTASATVRWIRARSESHWPGLGLELNFVTPEIGEAIRCAAHQRPALFHC